MSSNNPHSPRYDEQEPLLRSSVSNGENSQSTPSSRWGKLSQKLIPRFDVISSRYRFIPLLGCLIILFNEAEYMFKQVAVLRAIEAMHCIEYYQQHDPDVARMGKHIPEAMCKGDSVQKHVAATSALMIFVRMFSSMLGNLPLGYVADKKGRWIVLSMHKINVVASSAWIITVYLAYPSLPIWALYLSGLPGLIGGNFDLGLAMLFSSYADIMPNETQRTTLFYLTTSMQYPAQALCPLIGGWLMDLDGQGGTPELSLYLGFSSGVIAAILTLFFFPETLHESKKLDDLNSVDSDSTKPNSDGSTGTNEPRSIRASLMRKLKSTWRDLHYSFRYIGLGNMFLLSISILTASIGIKSIDWFALIQYPVIKLHWKFAQSSFVVSAQAVITLVNYAFLLPFYNRTGTNRFGLSSATTSIIIMLSSTCLLIVGSLVIGVSATVPMFFFGLVIYTLGAGLPVATQAYISGMIDKSKLARILASMSVVSVGGKVLGAVIFPKALAAGLDDGREIMKGLPLFVGAILFAVTLAALVVVAATARQKPVEPPISGAEETTNEI